MSSIVAEIRREIQAFADFLPLIAELEAPVYDVEFHRRLERIDNMSRACLGERPTLMRLMFDACTDELDTSVLMEHSRTKPFGYAGDFLINDWMLQRSIPSEGRGRLWDEFFQRQACARAARTRKDHFCEMLLSRWDHASPGISVLDLACGSCRDIAEAVDLGGTRTRGSYIHCVDSEPKAIEFARNVTRNSHQKVVWQWEVANVYRLRPVKKYDLTYTSGLFGYLNERLAVALLERMWRWTNEKGGRVVFCNMHPQNTSRSYMEWCGDWFVIHRSEQEMLDLCIKAGINGDCVTFSQEQVGVFTFCVAKK